MPYPLGNAKLVRRAGLEPARPEALAPKASASANSATFASRASVPVAERGVKDK